MKEICISQMENNNGINEFVRKFITTHFDCSNLYYDLSTALRGFREIVDKNCLLEYEKLYDDLLCYFYDCIDRITGYELVDRVNIQFAYKGTYRLSNSKNVEYTLLFVNVGNEFDNVCRACIGFYKNSENSYNVEYKLLDDYCEDCDDVKLNVFGEFKSIYGSYVCMVGEE